MHCCLQFLVTVTRQGDVARWSLHDGSLLSVQPCPCPLEADGVVESVRPVFYDQAVCVVVREGNDRSTAAVSDVRAVYLSVSPPSLCELCLVIKLYQFLS